MAFLIRTQIRSEVIGVRTANSIRNAVMPSDSAAWIIGDRRRPMTMVAADTPRTRAAIVIGSLIALLVVSMGVAVLT